MKIKIYKNLLFIFLFLSLLNNNNKVFGIDFSFLTPGTFTLQPSAVPIDSIIVGSDLISGVTLQIDFGLAINANFTIFSDNIVNVLLPQNDSSIDVGGSGGFIINGELNTVNNFRTNSILYLGENGSYKTVDLSFGGCNGVENKGSFSLNNSSFTISGNTLNSKDMNILSSELTLIRGNTILDSGSLINLTKSTLVNNGQVYTTSAQILMDSESSIINDFQGDITLHDNIELVGGSFGDAHILNSGIIQIDGKSPITISVPINNEYQVQIKQDVHIVKIDSYYNMFISDYKTLSTNYTVNIGGGQFDGNGTVANSLENYATIGGINTTSNIHIQGNYTEFENKTDLRFTIVNTTEYSLLTIDETASFNGGNITIRINKDITESENITIITHADKSGVQPRIQIVIIDVNTGQEVNQGKTCHETEHTSSKFQVLLNYNNKCHPSKSSESDESYSNDTTSSKSLTKAQIAGIVVACVGTAVVVSIIIGYVLYQKYKYTSSGLSLTKRMMSNK